MWIQKCTVCWRTACQMRVPEDMNMVEMGEATSNTSIEGTAESLATAYTYFRNTDFVNETMEQYSRLTKEKVLEVAKKYIDPNQKISIYYLPKQN